MGTDPAVATGVFVTTGNDRLEASIDVPWVIAFPVRQRSEASSASKMCALMGL